MLRVVRDADAPAAERIEPFGDPSVELSPNLGDGRAGQAAAVVD